MIRYARPMGFRARLAVRLGQLATRSRRWIRRALRWVRGGRLSWVVETGAVGLQDVARLERINLREERRRRERNAPGALGRWCEASCRGRFRQLSHREWAFSDASDARLFNLVWGTTDGGPAARPRHPPVPAG